MTKIAEFKKSSIHYTDTGKGRVVVLLHGFLGSHKVWKDYITGLSGKFRVIAIDLLGHGQTSSIGYYHSMELMAQSVRAVLKKVGVRRYVLAGHSMGGYVALAFAELYPENVSGVCLLHSTSYADSEDKKLERGRLIEVVKNGGKSKVTRTISSHFLTDENKKYLAKVEAIQAIANKTPEQSIANSLEGMKERKSRDLILKFAEYPVLFVVGKNDSIIEYNSVFSQIGLCKYPAFVVLEEQGHFGFVEAPDSVLPDLIAFIRLCFKKKID